MHKTDITINNTVFTFINQSWSKTNAWGHQSDLFKGDRHIATNRIRYYNRTWERYTFESCMSGCISNYINKLLLKELEEYKRKNNITRFKKSEKDKVLTEIELNSTDIINLRALYGHINSIILPL